MTTEKPTIRWGIVATGLISSWFVQDLVLSRSDAKANHIVQAVGSSSLEKGKAFVATHIPGTAPTVYGTYEQVYADPDVDVVYIGTPHAFHKENCLDAIRHGKNILCEKAFTLNVAEAREVFEAAEKKGVFVMEAMWTRFFPLVKTLQKLLHTDKVIGDVHRVFCDFGLKIDIASLPAESRYKDLSLGAGSLLDIGIYSLTWGLVGLGQAEKPKVVASQHLIHGVDVASSMVISFSGGQQGILTSSTNARTARNFCRIEGTKGIVVVEGDAASVPGFFTVYLDGSEEGKKYDFEKPGRGFYWEADAVALDINVGRKQNEDTMPWVETIRVLEILDEVRRQGGARFPQEE
ncbi:related to dimeric dihydrodiol dehydrogenase [Cephalotrichum gorgonifer]|uniref:D-xylose 1-dehydrogenase (NADP(+), D-xylono-1,5-lactone-forming) n=1 Tax=Cephalotrichum gorgonifer TaxID=2041049 RepID=A0AAE8SX32_9PEZI|nr:related to dimeric dihydrodiol dehydrogenase [Cephalotrichum gorgonifer]